MTNEIVVKQSEEMVKVKEFEQRIFEFLPGAKTIPADTRLAMAQIAVAHGLDPFLREIWPIPVKDRSGQIVGYDLMIGIAGWRSSAWRSNEYWGRRFEKCTPEERSWMGAQPNDIALKCIVMRRRTGQQPMEFDGYGLFKAGHEYTKMNPLQCTRYRAERDAMKAAFPISLPPGVTVKVADEETGEIINGTSYQGPVWTGMGDPEEYSDTIEGELIPPTEETQRTGEKPESPKDDPTMTKSSNKQATLRCDFARFNALADTFAKSYPRYAAKDGTLDRFHFLKAAGAEGFSEVTNENMDAVFSQVAQRHALDQADSK